MNLDEYRLQCIYDDSYKNECKIIQNKNEIYTGRIEFIDVIQGLNPFTKIKQIIINKNIIEIYI